MAIEPIPVTFHVSQEDRAEILEARRRRARPYRIVAQAVGLFSVLGLTFGFLASSVVQPTRTQVASAPAPAPAQPAPSFPIWRPGSTPAPASVAAAPALPAAGVDRTPVATIVENGVEPRRPASAEKPPASASAPARTPSFQAGERAPNYTGFRVTAGN
jgi:hypothetical protein